MNQEILKGKFKQYQSEVNSWWGKHADGDHDRAAGNLDQSFDQQGHEIPKQVSSVPLPAVLKNIFTRLAGLVTLTEVEREEAGVYIGDHQD